MSADLVFKGEDGQILTNSLLVAEKFGKQHQHVMRDIRELQEAAVQNWTPAFDNENTNPEKSGFVENQLIDSMFDEVEYEYVVNGAKRKAPMYVMNRDGFSLLVMGFTGRKALKFKLDFIAAFNRMEKRIAEAPKMGVENISRKELAQMLLDSEQELERANARIEELERKEDISVRMDRMEELLRTTVAGPFSEGYRERVSDFWKSQFYPKGHNAISPSQIKKRYPGAMTLTATCREIRNRTGIRLNVAALKLWLIRNGYMITNEQVCDFPSEESMKNRWMACYYRGFGSDNRWEYTHFLTKEGFERIIWEIKEQDNRLF